MHCVAIACQSLAYFVEIISVFIVNVARKALKSGKKIKPVPCGSYLDQFSQNFSKSLPVSRLCSIRWATSNYCRMTATNKFRPTNATNNEYDMK